MLGYNFFEGSLDNWWSINGKLKGMFGENYVDRFEKEFDEILECVANKMEKVNWGWKKSFYYEENKLEGCACIEQEKLSADHKRLEVEQEVDQKIEYRVKMINSNY